jgi:hypothetical protein
MEPSLKDVKQRRRNAAQWRELIKAWKQSGKTRKLWCKENGIAYESLRRWTKRLRGTSEKVSLVEISRAAKSEGYSGEVRLRICNDGEIELQGELSEKLLRMVLNVMREPLDVH